PGQGGDDAHRNGVGGVRPGRAVEDVEVLTVQAVRDEGLQASRRVRLHRRVRPPPDVLLAPRPADDVFVLRTAAGEAAGIHGERAVVGKAAFAVADGVLHQGGRGEVRVD